MTRIGDRVSLRAAFTALVLLVGCEAQRPARSEAELKERRETLVKEMLDGRVALSRSVVARGIAEQDAEKTTGAPACLDMLILSGGGDYGAFGAGVLKGWGQVSGEMARPEFDVVTGVSTGALIAPLAFVGSEDAYERAFQVFQNPKPQWFRDRGLFAILIEKASLTDNTGLRQDMETTIDEAMIREIASGHEQNRALLIGTTNIDMGMLTMWDVGKIAHDIISGGKRRDRLDDVVMASASIPGVFPPVEIDGDLYVDGGVTRNIAYTTDQEFPNSAGNIWMREHPDRPLPKIRFWVIINNQLGTAPKQVAAGWPSLMVRSLEVSIRSSTISSLKGLAVTSILMRLRGNANVEFRYISIPDEWRPPVEGAFKKETMISLAELGKAMGADPANWKVTVPNPESPEP
jgi:hypothetical protein